MYIENFKEMAVTNETLYFKTQLVKLISNEYEHQGQALDILKRLDDLDVTMDILKSTKIAMTVQKFLMCCRDNETKLFAHKLLMKWKQVITNNTVISTNGPVSNNSGIAVSKNTKKEKSKKKNNKKNCEIAASKHAKNEKSKKKNKTPKLSDKKNDNNYYNIFSEIAVSKDTKNENNKTVKNNIITSDMRASSRNKILNALDTTNEVCKYVNFKKLADQLEQCIFSNCKNDEFKYKCRILTRCFNLKNPKNPDLRIRFALGIITPAQMATFTHNELASKGNEIYSTS